MKLSLPYIFLIISLLAVHSTFIQHGDIFPAQNPPKEISGVKIKENLPINGHWEEDSWRLAPLADGFFKQFPNQGGKPKFDTQIKILYHKKNLYFGFSAMILWVKKVFEYPIYSVILIILNMI